MEQEILVTMASGLLQLAGLSILACLLIAPTEDRGFLRERLLIVCICCLGVVTVLAGLNQMECSLSGGLTISVLTLGAIARVGLDARHGASSVY